MTRGRKPKPTALKELNGSAAHNPDRINHDEPKPIHGAPDLPPIVNRDEIARREWFRMVEVLSGLKLLTIDIGSALEMYCTSYSGYCTAQDAVHRYGQAIPHKDKDGNVELRRNPFSVELHKYKDECHKWLIEFGLTPSSRSRVSSYGGQGETDPASAYMAGLQQFSSSRN